VTGGVERFGGLGVGVVVDEPVERGEGVGWVWRVCQPVGGIGMVRLVVCPPRNRP